MTENSIRTELAAAFRAVAARYRSIPEAKRPDVSWAATDDVLEDVLGAGDREQSLAAIREWKTHWFSLFAEAER